MKILYGIQCTGNGHLSRAREVIPHLMKHGEVDLLLSGKQSDVSLMYSVRYRKDGLTFSFGKNGGISLGNTLKDLRPVRLIRDIYSCPVEQYDVVLNDFEPVSAWACKRKKINCVALSHQSAFYSPLTPRPEKRNRMAEKILRDYAPANDWFGFHFQHYDERIYTPVIRSAVRHALITEGNHVTVYLPAYSDDTLIRHLSQIKEVRWEIFSKNTDHLYTEGNITLCKINDGAFIQSMASSCGVLTGGGFETPSEVLFLGKKLLSIPMQSQYEQQCNSAALKQMNVMVLKKVDAGFTGALREWLHHTEPVRVFYPDQTADIVSQAVHAALRREARRA